ncbi:hypothetical protein Syun_009142 [Stephania yunnanensis]|uniref:Uncharacterized protein n=1 Tax=Stephania yunnanensis TaxID=152371 RepID=A0AAP0PN82_9MAGN
MGVYIHLNSKLPVTSPFVNLESTPLASSVGFFKNGKWLGIAKELDARNHGLVDAQVKEMQCASALFPHVLLKNVVVKV